MAEEANVPAVVDDAKPTEETTRTPEAPADTAAAVEAEPVTEGEAATSDDVAKDAAPSSPKPESATEDAKDATGTAENGTDAPNGTPAAKTPTVNRRKSIQKKTPGGKKGKAPELHLDAQPGDTYLVSMKGYPPWPVIICDEEMLPESLLSKRPVSAKRIDGTYREDFADNGNHVRERRFPIMFLGTNEFSWEVNTALQTLDIDAVKKEVAEGTSSKKKKKALWSAYEVAAEEHDLAYFKELLQGHEEALQLDAEEQAAAAAKKAELKEKKKRKSIAPGEDDEDVDMEDAEGTASAKKPKVTKKRKKTDESEGEADKPVKTPKTKLKLNNKPAKDTPASAKPKKTPKAKAAKSESAESEASKVEEKPMTEAERREKQEKSVLYLRHRLQKGFLARDQAPKEDEMANMDDYFKQLEEIQNLEAEIIRKTKVHKVLRAIIKLSSIPKEEEYQFKKRSGDLLQSWSGALASEEASAAPAAPAATNGVKHEEEKKEDTADITEKVEKTSLEPDVKTEAPKATAGEDVPMADADDKTEDVKVAAPADDADAVPKATTEEVAST